MALAVVAVWGTNFVVIKLALGQMPPLLFATLRFVVVVVPGVFLLPRPAVPWRNLAAYGLLIGVGQFGLLFVAMNGHISPGLASLVIQTQVFFTIGLAMLMAGESLQRVQWIALALGAAGLGVIVSHTDGSTTLLGLGLILLAALSWAGGNLVSRAAGRINMVAYVVWSSLFAVPPLLALSLWVEGWDTLAAGLQQADAFAWGAVAWQAGSFHVAWENRGKPSNWIAPDDTNMGFYVHRVARWIVVPIRAPMALTIASSVSKLWLWVMISVDS